MNPTQPDRRTFLKGTASAALAAGVTSYAHGKDQATVRDAQSPVRVAVIGTGGRGCDLIRALTTIEGCEVTAVCDEYEPHLHRGQKYAGLKAKPFFRHQHLLDQIEVDVVVVAVPLDRHFAVCRDVIEAGHDVFCEKTMCYSIEEAQQLAALVEKHATVFQVGLQRRANAVYRQAAAMVETGMLGRIVAIKCQWHRNNNWRRPVPVPQGDPHWQQFEHRLNWRLYRNYSQGLMAELGSHQLDVVDQLLKVPPRRVLGTGGIDYWRDGRDVYDNIFCTFEYELPWPEATTPKPSRATGPSKSPTTGPAATSPQAAPTFLPQTPQPEVPTDTSEPQKQKPYTVRVTYSSLQSNAFEGASELILGDRGTLFLTHQKGLFYREAGVDNPGWDREGRVEHDAAIVTSGKTLKMSNDPWAGRGKPYEIDTTGDDTRDQLVSFIRNLQQRQHDTICNVHTGLRNTAIVVTANQAIDGQKMIEFPEL